MFNKKMVYLNDGVWVTEEEWDNILSGGWNDNTKDDITIKDDEYYNSLGNYSEIIKWADENKISEDVIPRDEEELRNLIYLELRDYTYLQYLPMSIGELKNLTELYLSGCKSLQSIPESIGELKNLKRLELYYCSSLKSLPDSIGKLKKLKELTLYAEDDKVLANMIDIIKHCDSLEDLDIVGDFTTLPSSIGELENLTDLTLRDCPSLQSLPESIGELKNLTNLELSGCETLQSLPSSIGELENLERLYIDDFAFDIPEILLEKEEQGKLEIYR